MNTSKPVRVFRRARQFVIKGLLFALPIVVSVVVLKFFLDWVDGWLEPISSALVRAVAPESWLVGPFAGGHVPGVSLALAVIFLGVLGAIASWPLGRRGLSLIDIVFGKIPVLRSVYSAVRKIMNLFGESDGQSRFREVVFIKDIFGPNVRVPALVVAKTQDDATGETWLTIVIPSTPNPTGGQVLIVAEKQVIYAGTAMTPAQLLQWGMSLGMLTPSVMTLNKNSK